MEQFAWIGEKIIVYIRLVTMYNIFVTYIL